MIARILQRLKLTEGEQGLLLATVGLSVFGGGLAFMVLSQLGNSGQLLREFSLYNIWIVLSGAIGTAIAFTLGREWFGDEGTRGWRRAAIGTGVVSLLASIIGGTLALPIYGTMFGPFSVVVTMIGAPFLAFLWFVTLLASHLLVLQWRRERDTIFVPRGAAV